MSLINGQTAQEIAREIKWREEFVSLDLTDSLPIDIYPHDKKINEYGEFNHPRIEEAYLFYRSACKARHQESLDKNKEALEVLEYLEHECNQVGSNDLYEFITPVIKIIRSALSGGVE